MRLPAIYLVFIFALVPTFIPAYASKKSDAKKQIDTLNQQVQTYGEEGDLQAAIDAAEKALDIANKTFGEDSAEAAKAMNNVANLYMYADNAESAENLYKKAILIAAAKDPKSLDAAGSYYNLAMAYAVQKKYTEASSMLDKVYKIRVEKLGQEHPDTAAARKALDEVWAASAH